LKQQLLQRADCGTRKLAGGLLAEGVADNGPYGEAVAAAVGGGFAVVLLLTLGALWSILLTATLL